MTKSDLVFFLRWLRDATDVQPNCMDDDDIDRLAENFLDDTTETAPCWNCQHVYSVSCTVYCPNCAAPRDKLWED